MIDHPVPLAEVVAGIADLDDPDTPTRVTEVGATLPVELGLAVRDGRVQEIAGTPPTQTVETSVLPVWHVLSIRVVSS